MKFVLDSSVALNWVLREGDSERALRLRAAILRRAHDALVLDVFPIEAAHALIKAERRGIAAPGHATNLLGVILEVPLDLRSSQVHLPRAMRIASERRVGVYDSLYVALAEAENCEVITADEWLVRALPDAPIRLLSSLTE